MSYVASKYSTKVHPNLKGERMAIQHDRTFNESNAQPPLQVQNLNLRHVGEVFIVVDQQTTEIIDRKIITAFDFLMVSSFSKLKFH